MVWKTENTREMTMFRWNRKRDFMGVDRVNADKPADIFIKGLVGVDGTGDSIELYTEGKYGYSDGKASLEYFESELTGMNGTMTTVDVWPESAMLTRQGEVVMHMLFEVGRKNFFQYATPFGQINMGMSTDRITGSFNEDGGHLEVDYRLEMLNTSVFTENNLVIDVKRREKFVPEPPSRSGKHEIPDFINEICAKVKAELDQDPQMQAWAKEAEKERIQKAAEKAARDAEKAAKEAERAAKDAAEKARAAEAAQKAAQEAQKAAEDAQKEEKEEEGEDGK